MKSAKELLKESYVIDTHLDLLTDLGIKHEQGIRRVIKDNYLETFKAGEVDAINAAIYVDSGHTPEKSLNIAMNQLAALYRELESDWQYIGLATCTDDLLRLKSQNRLAIILSLEGAEPLAANPDMLRLFYRMGVRIIALTWSRENWAADGSRLFEQDYVGTGISAKGWQTLHLARKLGMLVDVSHLNDLGFEEIMQWETRPIIATHSNARALAPTQRNLTDKQIKQIGAKGGVIGANGISLLVDYKCRANANLSSLVAHMVHVKEIAGAETVCIGLDQCERLADTLASTIDGDTEFHDVLPTHEGMEALVEELQKAGFSDEEIIGVLGGNALRVFRRTIG